MQVEIKSKREVFKPVSITITLDTAKELAVFASIFNFTPIIETVRLLSSIKAEKIGALLVDAGADLKYDNVFKHFHTTLKETMNLQKGD